MSLDDHLNRLREDADRQIPIPIDLQTNLKFAVRQADRLAPVRPSLWSRLRLWPKLPPVTACILLVGLLGFVAVRTITPNQGPAGDGFHGQGTSGRMYSGAADDGILQVRVVLNHQGNGDWHVFSTIQNMQNVSNRTVELTYDCDNLIRIDASLIKRDCNPLPNIVLEAGQTKTEELTLPGRYQGMPTSASLAYSIRSEGKQDPVRTLKVPIEGPARMDDVFGVGLYPGAELITSNPERQYQIQTATPEQVQRWHETHLKVTGWDILSTDKETQQSAVILKARKGDSHVWLRIEPHKHEVLVTLSRPAEGGRSDLTPSTVVEKLKAHGHTAEVTGESSMILFGANKEVTVTVDGKTPVQVYVFDDQAAAEQAFAIASDPQKNTVSWAVEPHFVVMGNLLVNVGTNDKVLADRLVGVLNSDKAKVGSSLMSPTLPNEPQKLESAEQAIERAKVVLASKTAARYEAIHVDNWMPTVPTSRDSPRPAWKVQLYDASGRYTGWVVLDAETGGPLQMGDV